MEYFLQKMCYLRASFGAFMTLLGNTNYSFEKGSDCQNRSALFSALIPTFLAEIRIPSLAISDVAKNGK